MSSRNALLNNKERVLASAIYRILLSAKQKYNNTSLNDIKNWASEIALENSELIEQKNGYVRSRFSAIKNNDIREQIFTIVNERGWELRELSLQTPSLEDLFVSLTNGEEGNR